jgi:hypothetical protein
MTSVQQRMPHSLESFVVVLFLHLVAGGEYFEAPDRRKVLTSPSRTIISCHFPGLYFEVALICPTWNHLLIIWLLISSRGVL